MVFFRSPLVNFSLFFERGMRKCSSFSKNDTLPFSQYVYNRNPRNLEKLRIAYKPAGYHLEKPGREFWHK